MPKPRNRKKVLVIGLDSAPPELLFNGFIDDLPMHACMHARDEN